MGVTVAYRGRIKDPAAIETFEDVVLDLALEMDGMARVWRSADDRDPRRVVRGVMLDLAPGVEPVSLLVSPEGWLVPLHEIEAAERGPVREPPWIFVKTQFGPVEAHVALCEMLGALGKEFLADLEIRDDGGYWPKRDLAELQRSRGAIDAGIKMLSAALEPSKIHPEDRDDPELLGKHVERIAEKVRRLVARPPEHAPVRFGDDDDPDADPDAYGTEEQWDAAFRENRRKQEKMSRFIEERTLGGEPVESALDAAMSDPGILDVPDPGTAEDAEEQEGADPVPEPFGHGTGQGAEVGDDVDEINAACREAVAEMEAEEAVAPKRRERHPLLERMHALTLRALRLPERKEAGPAGPLSQLVQGILEMSGGLAQVLGSWESGEDEDDGSVGLNVVQLKRALRGAAFALGALVPARAAGLLAKEDAEFIGREAEAIEGEIRERLWSARERLNRKGRP